MRRLAMSLLTPEKIRKLQKALHGKAKGEPQYRFYALYDKIYRRDILEFAYRLNRSNRGKAGVDGQDFESIETYGLDRWLGELAEDLKSRTYRPQAVRRVYIPKQDGGRRPLGIPTVKDRTVQTAALIVLEPIFEADLQPEQHAYRPGRNALDAVREVHKLLNTGHQEVVDADLSGYFDSIPHAELMKSVARRISDRHVLHLIKMWLQMPVEEEDDKGNKQRTTRNRDTGRGTPQGAPISPLLSNLYMRRFILGWKVFGHEKRLKAYIVNYADDLVICCRGTAREARAAMQDLIQKLKLTINETKTHLCRIPEESFDFLGYTIGRCFSPKTGKAYIGTRPSKERLKRVCNTITDLTHRRWGLLSAEACTARLNRVLVGWSNYFCLGPVSKTYRAVERHTRHRLRQWLRRKHKLQGQGTSRFPDQYLHETLGLVELQKRTRSFPWAKA